VVLLEIGLWEPLQRLSKNLKRGVSYETVFDTIMDLSSKHLPQFMGSSYTSIVKQCLTQGNQDIPMTHTDFDRRIVSVLEEVVQILERNSA
jgi:hypothetical protein